MDLQTVILAAGRGSRIRPLTDRLPKPLLKIGGIPIIERLIINLRNIGIIDLHLVVGYRKEQIINYLGDGYKLGVHIVYSTQKKIGYAEDAIRISLSKVSSQYVMYMCADDLLMSSHLQQLIWNLDKSIDGVVLIKTVKGANIPRLYINKDMKIIGLSDNDSNPIMLYNFAIKTEVLHNWINQNKRKESLVCSIEKILQNHTLLAVWAENVFTINTVEQLSLAEQCNFSL